MPKMSWRLILRIIAVIACIVSIAWYFDEPGFGPVVSFLSGVLALISSFVVSDAPISIPTSEKVKSAREVRNREAMLKLVNDTWIKGVLGQSLHGAALIALGLEERKDAVESPWGKVLQTPDQPDCLLPPDTKIVDVFDEMGQNLLILGEPESGKTTMLLELARDTIARAEKDSNEPIPVVFNLSSWTHSKQSIADWLVEELNTQYKRPKKIALSWIENDMLLLLLDGLDEVALDRREKCVEAINEFQKEHLVPLVVCSRVADYEALDSPLKLQSAVLLLPLTPQQVNDYLNRAGPEFAAVHEALKKDTSLQELAQSPLMLNIMTLAYRGISVEDLQPLETIEGRHKHLFDTYVQQMFKRRGADKRYSDKKSIHWLSWLARKMSQHAQSVFLIERMQRSWLQTYAQRQLFTVCIVLICMSILGLSFGLYGGLCSEATLGLLIFGVFFGLLSGLVLGLNAKWEQDLKTALLGRNAKWEQDLKIVEVVKWRDKEGKWVIFWLSFGLIMGLIIWLSEGLLLEGLIFGLIIWLSGGLLSGGSEVIEHYVLRFILYRNGYIPWNYARFLGYAAERIFLRKVGGGYIFVHRLLMDYFASLEPEQEGC